jgi:hypothetical protein
LLSSSLESDESIQIKDNGVEIQIKELKIVTQVGGGSYGQVFQAIWHGNHVAVKVLDIPQLNRKRRLKTIAGNLTKAPGEEDRAGEWTAPSTIDDDGAGALADFEREVGILAQIQHPNIVKYIGYTYFFDKIFGVLKGAIVMDFIDGPNLLDVPTTPSPSLPPTHPPSLPPSPTSTFVDSFPPPHSLLLSSLPLPLPQPFTQIILASSQHLAENSPVSPATRLLPDGTVEADSPVPLPVLAGACSLVHDVNIAVQIANGLSHLHSTNVIHR